MNVDGELLRLLIDIRDTYLLPGGRLPRRLQETIERVAEGTASPCVLCGRPASICRGDYDIVNGAGPSMDYLAVPDRLASSSEPQGELDDAADAHPGIGEAGPPINTLCRRCSCIVGQNALVHDVAITDGRVMILRCNNRQPASSVPVRASGAES